MDRPSRTALEGLIRKFKGNLTLLAASLDVCRPTLYKWIHQLDLAGVAGVYIVASGCRKHSEDTESRKNVSAGAAGERNLQAVSSSPTAIADPRVNTSVRIRESVWKRMRMLAIAEGRTVAEVLEDASRAYLSRMESAQARSSRAGHGAA